VIVKALSDEQVKQLTTLGGWGLAACVVLYLVYQYVLVGLYLGPRGDLVTQYNKVNKDNDTSSKLLETAARDEILWAKMAIPNIKNDPDERDMLAEQVKSAYYEAASRAGFSFTTWNDTGTFPSPQRPDFKEVRFTATAMLSSNRLAGFLYLVEHYDQVPARVDQLNIRAQTPGQDYLHVDMAISALLYNPVTPIPRITSPDLVATRGGRPTATTRSGRGQTTRPTGTRTGAGTRAEAPPPDPEAEAKLVERRLKQEEEAAAKQKEIEEFKLLSPEQQEEWLTKKRERDAIAATQREAEEAIAKQKREAEQAILKKQKEEEMLRRRQEEEGIATTAPGATTQGGTQ
jgi:hypothetical protein